MTRFWWRAETMGPICDEGLGRAVRKGERAAQGSMAPKAETEHDDPIPSDAEPASPDQRTPQPTRFRADRSHRRQYHCCAAPHSSPSIGATRKAAQSRQRCLRDDLRLVFPRQGKAAISVIGNLYLPELDGSTHKLGQVLFDDRPRGMPPCRIRRYGADPLPGPVSERRGPTDGTTRPLTSPALSFRPFC